MNEYAAGRVAEWTGGGAAWRGREKAESRMENQKNQPEEMETSVAKGLPGGGGRRHALLCAGDCAATRRQWRGAGLLRAKSADAQDEGRGTCSGLWDDWRFRCHFSSSTLLASDSGAVSRETH